MTNPAAPNTHSPAASAADADTAPVEPSVGPNVTSDPEHVAEPAAPAEGLATPDDTPAPSGEIAERVAEVLAGAPVFDGHNDLPYALRKRGYDLDATDIALNQPELHTDIERLRDGGVGAQFWSVFVAGDQDGGTALTQVLEQIDCVQRIIDKYPDTFAFARTADDVRAAWAQGKIASLMGAEGGHSINESLGVLRVLRRLGVAYMTLTHNQNVPWADSATDTPKVGGLNDFGREVVAEMNRIGMLVDISHVAETTMRDAIAASTAPVIFSHSSCRALCDHVRDAPDDVLRSLADGGGVIMITFVPSFVSQQTADHRAAEREQQQRLGLADWLDDTAPPPDPAAKAEFDAWLAANPEPVATLAQVADHVEHAREVAGVSSIGLGGDYDGVPSTPRGLEDVSKYPALLAELAERGWSDADLAALTSGNIMRVLSEAERIADPGFGGPAPSMG
ncbi:dipeptidase [Nakamurella aerolata]|uniref:Membrane dipeptidase n=1 Tax=Nakamurella aerolata TaxID=1656892 RepID=A0A849A1P8_9ACTN|nr:dipeptidase [Nakamurella aerolata]NNG34964.1 membrane dipeptidase [Nakamurella aerolata]